MTFVGRQSGNTLTDSGVDGIARMHMGVKSPEELMKSSRTMLTVASGIGVIVGAALMLLGLMGGKKNSERKERKKG